MQTLTPFIARLAVLIVLILPVAAVPALGLALAATCAGAGALLLWPSSARADGDDASRDEDSARETDDAKGEKKKGPQKVSVDIHDARLIDVVIRFSQVTGENFVLMEKDLQEKRITVYAPGAVTIPEARQMLISVLVLSGLRVEDKGSYWAITRAD